MLLAAALVLLAPRVACAYIGPGAGFALAGAFFAVFLALSSAALLLVTWPVRVLWRVLAGPRAARRGGVGRVVILGLDGMDYGLTQKLISGGRLPHLEALAREGCFRPLTSTVPPISPVAWSSFQTGVNPGKHNIFDFLAPDARSYRPALSSVEIKPPQRSIRAGRWRWPVGRARVRLLRKSKPFWSVLGEHGVFSCILRVPISFPPERFRGVQLSAMCVPDLRGTQGTFAYYASGRPAGAERIGGEVRSVTRRGNVVRAELVGPENPLRADGRALRIPFTVTVRNQEQAALKIDGVRYELSRGRYTEWIRVGFRAAPGVKVHGLCKFLLRSAEPEFELYATPLNIDPEAPVLPISHPAVYSAYLAKRQGPFATLGLAEDAWALSERILDDEEFIQQCLDADGEREAMFFDALDKVRRGLIVCVFDGLDRLQHAFWRDIDQEHPAHPDDASRNGRTVIEDQYRRMDGLVGRAAARCRATETRLLVISDHGFSTFRRGVDLNRWLEENGYLKMHEHRRGEAYLAGVDWTRTRAFAVGLAGIYLNVQGQYAQGIVAPGGEAERIADEIARRLVALVDPQTGRGAVKRVYRASQVYQGPYKDRAPELIVGYERGYRASWETAVGRTTDEVFHSNRKPWSGDHCIDRSLVPGVLFCDRAVQADAPRLIDIGPTVLQLFGVRVPEYMDGRPLGVGEAAGASLRARPADGLEAI